MKAARSLTFKRITRAFYLMGVVFLLAGMLLSVANIPAQAGSPSPESGQATRLPPGSVVKPPVVQPPATRPTLAAPVVPPASQPGTAPQGPGAQNLNRGAVAPAAPLVRPGPSVLALIPGAAVHFTQSNYCYAGAAGPVDATVTITLPAGVEEAWLQVDWYVVWPRSGDIVHHYSSPEQSFSNGDTYTFTGQWPGIDMWQPGNTVEIHFGAILLDENGDPISDGTGLDVFYNGRCDERPTPVLVYECQADGVLWTLGNAAFEPISYSYTVNGQPGGSGVLAARSTTTFTTVAGATVVVTYHNGLGGTATITGTAPENCGYTPQPLTLTHACTAEGVTWYVTNPNPIAINYTYSLDGGAQVSGSVAANSTASVVSASNTAAAHTLSLTSVTGTITNTSGANECTQQEAELVVLHECLTDTNTIQWRVRNDGTAGTSFTWNLDSGAQTGSGFVAAGETVDVVISTNGSHRVDVTWSTGTSFGVSETGFCVATPPSVTLRHACNEVTGGIDWYATNTGATTLASLGWSLDDGDSTGTVENIASGQEVFLTHSSGGAHEMQVTFGNGITVTDTSEDGECGLDLLPLTLTHACTAAGVTWTLTNPNAVDVVFDYNLDNGVEVGIDRVVGANSSVTVTSAADTTIAHALTVDSDAGLVTDESDADECTEEEAVLEVLHQCVLENNTIQWQVRNNGNADTTFTWRLDGGAWSVTPVFVAAGDTVNVITSSNGAHTLEVQWSTGTDLGESSADFCLAPPNITLRHSCDLETGGINWYASNTGQVSTTVEWSLDSGAQSGSVVVPGGAEVLLTTSTSGLHEMQVTLEGGTVITDTSDAEDCGLPNLEPLIIDYDCVVVGGVDTLAWTVTNTNLSAVTFNWRLDTGAWSGNVTVNAGATLQFTTSTADTAHTMYLRWPNGSGTFDQVSLASPADACGTPPLPSLSLEHACILGTSNIEWTVSNTGTVDNVPFTWTLDEGAQSGGGTAVIGTPTMILVTNDSTAHTVILRWTTTTGTLAIQRTSNADQCFISTTTVTVTPGTETVTVTPGTETVTVTPGTETVTVTPGTETVTVTPGTETVTVTPGTETVTVTPGTETVTVTPGTETVTVTPGTDTATVPVTETPGAGTGTPEPLVGGGTGGAAQGTPTPIAQVGVPVTGDQQALAGAYGADLSDLAGAGLWQRILLNGGLLFLGLGLIFEGLGRKRR